jgi:hypothetical protein
MKCPTCQNCWSEDGCPFCGLCLRCVTIEECRIQTENMRGMFIAFTKHKASFELREPKHICNMRVLTMEEMAARNLEGRA